MQKGQKKNSWVKKYDISLEYETNKQRIGRGTYGTVFKAKNLIENKYYAIKKLQNNDQKIQAEGFPITALREITLLKRMNHPNIIKLKEIITSKQSQRNQKKGSTFLVFEYMHHDLAGIFKKKIKFSLPEIKCITKQLLQGVSYLHANQILHRDIKAANILLNDKGQIKLADFGLGRKFTPNGYYTSKVVTLWYRAPQLLIGLKQYNEKVDVWSLGCVIAEMFTQQIIFRKDTEYSQLDRIIELCGDFYENGYTPQLINQCCSFRDMEADKKKSTRKLKDHLKHLNDSIDDISLDFLDQLLQVNPNSRLSCEQALQHQFFKTQPLACDRTKIQKFDHELHELIRDEMKIVYPQTPKKQIKQEYQKKKYYQHYNKPKNDYHRNRDSYERRHKSPKRYHKDSRSESYPSKSRSREKKKKRQYRQRSRQKKYDRYDRYERKKSYDRYSRQRSYDRYEGHRQSKYERQRNYNHSKTSNKQYKKYKQQKHSMNDY